jgi:hypothetical protein
MKERMTQPRRDGESTLVRLVVEHVGLTRRMVRRGRWDVVRNVKAAGYVRKERMKQLLEDLKASGHQDEDVLGIESICTSPLFSVIRCSG